MTEIIDKFMQSSFSDISGNPVNPGNYGNPKLFAQELGHFLRTLQKLDTKEVATPSFENQFAGSELVFFEAEILDLLNAYNKIVPKEFLTIALENAIKKPLKKTVWLHGDFTAKNILVKDGKLSGVLKIDKAVVGDPACDLAIAWQLFDSHVRKIFFGATETDATTIERARMQALRQALKTYNSANIDEQIMARDALSEILEELDYKGQDELFDSHIAID